MGVVPIVNENDTLAVAVSLSDLRTVKEAMLRMIIGN
jgi:glutamate 5-kinase